MYTASGTKAYAQVSVESAVMSASPHQLIEMLFDGANSAWCALACLCNRVISSPKVKR